MSKSAEAVRKPKLLVIDGKKLRQAGMTRLLETWAEATGLTLSALVQTAPLDTGCASVPCEMAIINLGSASIREAPHRELVASVRRFMPEARLVIISDREEPQEVSAAFEQGAIGFMPTSTDPAVVFHALSFIRKGGSFFPPSALSTYLRRTGNGVGRAADLTPKQMEVFNRLREGHSNKTIARQLEMSEGTVKVHVRRIMQKFGAANRTQLAISALNDSSLPAAVDGRGLVDEDNDTARSPILSAGMKIQEASGTARIARGEGVMDFLRTLLGHGGSVPVIEIQRRAHAVGLLAAGCSISQDKAFRRARSRLSVLTYQQARRWFWRLPDQTLCSAICAPTSTSDAAAL